MKLLISSIALLVVVGVSVAQADELAAAPFDMDSVRDPSTLETTVIHDWQPSARHPDIDQKLIEITVCEWWPGQKVRLPVTLNIPAGATAIENLVVANAPLTLKAATPRGVELDLLQNHGVGIVYIGMSTIDAMKPAGELHIGMRKHLLKTKDIRYTPAWIWGMSQMRALTAAAAETAIFQPKKVLTTGGSKRGVAAAAAGIHDDRFTAILPVVAPILGNPGGSYVTGTDDPDIIKANEQFLADIAAGKMSLDPGVKTALDGRTRRREDQRITLQQAQDAGWSAKEIAAITDRAWQLCKITSYLPAVQKRGLDFFYFVGTNDSVSPALLELGKTHSDFSHYIVPGGQHGGPANAGFTVRTPLVEAAADNYRSFARAHFFDARTIPATPQIVHRFDRKTSTIDVSVAFPDGTEPDLNELAFSINRHRPYTLAFEYDAWTTRALDKSEDAPATYHASLAVPPGATRVEFLTTHRHTVDGLPFHISSALQQFAVPER